MSENKDTTENLGSSHGYADIGTQKSPASIGRIEAQRKSVQQELNAIWQNEQPPNEIWIEVKDGDSVVEAMAFFGRDGYRPHWQLRDGTACHPSRFSRWREIKSA